MRFSPYYFQILIHFVFHIYFDLLQTLYSLQIIAESLSEDEIAGLKQMFKMIDTDNSGNITLEELKKGLEKVGANLMEAEINELLQSVSAKICFI